MALRARCSGLILGWCRNSVIGFSSFRLKYHHQHVGHESQQFASCRSVDADGWLLRGDQIPESWLHDHLPPLRQQPSGEGPLFTASDVL